MKNKWMGIVLWFAMILAMGASINHLAWTFGTVERSGREWLGWIPAVAIDCGLMALAYSIKQKRKAKRSSLVLWAGVIGFAVVSALANLYHALSVEGFVLNDQAVMIAKAVVLSATLPVAYIFLGEIISGDDAAQAEKSEKQSEREQRRADLQAEREANEAKRLLLEAERLLLEAERMSETESETEGESETVSETESKSEIESETVSETETESEPAGIPCPACGRSFRSINARNAHKCNGKQKEDGA